MRSVTPLRGSQGGYPGSGDRREIRGRASRRTQPRLLALASATSQAWMAGSVATRSITNFSMGRTRARSPRIGPPEERLPSVTAISSGVRPPCRSPCSETSHDMSARRDATFLAALALVLGSRMPVYGIIPRYVHMFVPIHPHGGIWLRTYVPPKHSIPAHAPSAQCALPGPLVPAARGRLRPRLGGRRGRAWPGRFAWVGLDAPPASYGLAQPLCASTRGANGAGPTGLRVSC
jgi:hypothetical protein